MRKFMVGLMVAGLLVGATPAALAGTHQDTVVDQVGDWFATVGKSGLDKDAIVAERKAKRIAKRASKEAEKAGKEAGKALDSLTR